MNRPFRRRVLYIPGYDPIPPRRYRELYRREGADQARISGYDIAMAPRPRGTRFGWGVTSVMGGQQTRADVTVLVWSDVVRASMGRSIPATYAQLVRTAWAYIASGALFRLMRLRRAPVLAALYPIAVLLAQLAVALLVGWAVWALIPSVFGVAGGILGVAGVLTLFRRLDGRFFAYYLMHDYAFTARDGGAYPPALSQRIEEFATAVTEALNSDVDEVLVVGHSSGAYLAVSVLADVLRAGRPGGAALSLLTLGHVVPMAAFLPRAGRLRDDLRLVSTSDALTWVDVSAPGDACCFGLCDPVAVSSVEPDNRRGPLVLSAAFRQTLSPQRQKALRGRWFRLHFQYLCAFDRPGDYDYFAITAGPATLAQRFAGRHHSPGRITRAVNDWPGRRTGAP